MGKQKCQSSQRWARCLTFAVVLFGLCTSGCDDDVGFALSLQPIYSEADLVLDSHLNGTWTDKDGDVTFNFQQTDGNVYKLVVTENEGGKESSAEFQAHLIRLGAHLFVDALPETSPNGSAFLLMHVLRAHSIARLEFTGDTMEMAFFNAAWLKKKSVDISSQNVDGTLLLTGTTEEVQNLLYLHENDDDAFLEPISLTRQELQP